MYTQISAETGVIGFVLYFGAVGVVLRKLRLLRARCKLDRRLASLDNLLFIFVLSFISLLLTGAFNSVAYQMLVPAFIGIGSALCIAGMAEADRLTGATAPAAAAAAPVRPVPPPRPRGPLPHLPRPLAPRFPREARKLG